MNYFPKYKEELKEAISINSLIDNFQYWIQICHNVGNKVSRTTFQTTNILFLKKIKQRNFHYCLFPKTIIIFINKIRKIPENGKIIRKYWLIIFKLNLVLFGLNLNELDVKIRDYTNHLNFCYQVPLDISVIGRHLNLVNCTRNIQPERENEYSSDEENND